MQILSSFFLHLHFVFTVFELQEEKSLEENETINVCKYFTFLFKSFLKQFLNFKKKKLLLKNLKPKMCAYFTSFLSVFKQRKGFC